MSDATVNTSKAGKSLDSVGFDRQIREIQRETADDSYYYFGGSANCSRVWRSYSLHEFPLPVEATLEGSHSTVPASPSGRVHDASRWEFLGTLKKHVARCPGISRGARAPRRAQDVAWHWETYGSSRRPYPSVHQPKPLGSREIPDEFLSEEAILIVDDVDILKKGRHSVGVSRQYAGSIGKVDNCQVAVDLVMAVPGEARNADQVTWPLGMELYLPKRWLEDDSFAHLREEVELPDDLEFRTKLEIALDLLRRARAAAVPHACIGADAAYGDSHGFRAQLRDWNEPYVLGRKPSKVRIIPRDSPEDAGPRLRSRTREEDIDETSIVSATTLAKEIDIWTEVEWTEGTKGPLSAAVARRWVTVVKQTNAGTERQEDGWLLLEKQGSDLKTWICWDVEDWSLEELVTYAHMRWPIEQFHRDAKQVLGLHHFEGRTWQGWNHHTTVVLSAHAYLSTQRAAHGAAAESLPPFSQVARTLIVEMATQTAQRHGLDRQQAEDVAEAFIRGYTDW